MFNYLNPTHDLYLFWLFLHFLLINNTLALIYYFLCVRRTNDSDNDSRPVEVCKCPKHRPKELYKKNLMGLLKKENTCAKRRSKSKRKKDSQTTNKSDRNSIRSRLNSSLDFSFYDNERSRSKGQGLLSQQGPAQQETNLSNMMMCELSPHLAAKRESLKRESVNKPATKHLEVPEVVVFNEDNDHVFSDKERLRGSKVDVTWSSNPFYLPGEAQ